MPFFIEVGTCDFDTLEKLAQNGWEGIMIEPVKEYFDKLVRYPQIHYENIVISENSDEVEFHYIDPTIITSENLNWLKGIGCINSQTGPMLRNKDLPIYKNCIKENIKSTTLNKLCEKYNVTRIDFLKIDVEGYDLNVLKTIDLDKIHVQTIKIEHKHLDDTLIVEYLEQFNYIVWTEKNDIYAIK